MLFVHENSVVRPNEWQKQNKNFFFAQRFLNISEQKLLNLRPMSFFKFFLRIFFGIWFIGLSTFVNWSMNTLKTHTKSCTDAQTHKHTHTDGHNDLETVDQFNENNRSIYLRNHS